MTTPRPGLTHHEHCWTYHLDCANEEIVRVRNRLAAVRSLCDRRDADHAEYARRIQSGELVTLDRFIGPAQLDVRDVRQAIGDPS